MATITTTAQPAAASSLKQAIIRHPLIAFFALAYAFSWLITLPLLLGTNGLGLFAYTVPSGIALALIVTQQFGPMVAGLAMASLTGSGAWHLLKQYLRLRVGLVAYLATLVGPPVMIMLGAIAVRGEGAWQALAPDGFTLVLIWLIQLAVAFLIGGALGEAGGWRGFALPRLQGRHGALLASLILVPCWVLWHLPLLFIPQAGTFQGSLLGFMGYVGSNVALSIIHTWVYNRTQGSLFMVTLVHAAVNASTRTLLPTIFAADRAAAPLVPLIGFGVWAVLLIIMTRGQLAYRKGRDAAAERSAAVQ